MISTTVADGVRTITIDRPSRRNALPAEGLEALRDVVTDASEPVLLLRGAGDAFCAGADLEEVGALADGEAARSFAELGQSVAQALSAYDGAVVAGIDGPARGGGVELALACDLRVCTPRSTFAESGVAIGLFGAWGGTARLPAIVGRGTALDLALTGRVIDAETALRCGLVSQVVEDPAGVARTIATNDAAAVRAVGDLLRVERDEAWIEAQEARERDAFAALVDAGRPIRKD